MKKIFCFLALGLSVTHAGFSFSQWRGVERHLPEKMIEAHPVFGELYLPAIANLRLASGLYKKNPQGREKDEIGELCPIFSIFLKELFPSPSGQFSWNNLKFAPFLGLNGFQIGSILKLFRQEEKYPEIILYEKIKRILNNEKDQEEKLEHATEDEVVWIEGLKAIIQNFKTKKPEREIFEYFEKNFLNLKESKELRALREELIDALDSEAINRLNRLKSNQKETKVMNLDWLDEITKTKKDYVKKIENLKNRSDARWDRDKNHNRDLLAFLFASSDKELRQQKDLPEDILEKSLLVFFFNRFETEKEMAAFVEGLGGEKGFVFGPLEENCRFNLKSFEEHTRALMWGHKVLNSFAYPENYYFSYNGNSVYQPTKDKTITYSNCMESSIMQVFDLLFYRDKNFQTKGLKQGTPLFHFYQNRGERGTKPEIEWNNIMCSLPGLMNEKDIVFLQRSR
jgi:hypothetical protein